MSAMAPAPERPAQDDSKYLGPFTDVSGAPLLLAGTEEDDSADRESHIWRSID